MSNPRNPEARMSEKSTCPDFEDLSRYVDGELDEARHADVQAHATECAQCARILTTVGTWLDATTAPSDAAFGGSPCASMELLVGYMTNGLAETDRLGVDSHVRACDECIRTLTLLHSRLSCASEMDAAVPAAVLERVAAVLPVRQANPMVYADWSEALAAVGGRLTDALKLPVLIPAAVAAGALLVVAEQQMLVNPSPLKEMSRSAPVQQSLRVTALEAAIHTQPSSHADVVATVTRGTVLTIGSQEREWYRVALSDGREGWVERHAFD